MSVFGSQFFDILFSFLQFYVKECSFVVCIFPRLQRICCQFCTIFPAFFCSFRVFSQSHYLVKIRFSLLDHFGNIVINFCRRHLDCVAIVKADYPPVHKRAENDAQPRGKKHPTRHQSPYQKPFFQSRFPPHTLYIFNLLCSQKLHTAFTKIFHPQKCEKNGCVYNVYNI